MLRSGPHRSGRADGDRPARRLAAGGLALFAAEGGGFYAAAREVPPGRLQPRGFDVTRCTPKAVSSRPHSMGSVNASPNSSQAIAAVHGGTR